jgi:hypothetical protein
MELFFPFTKFTLESCLEPAKDHEGTEGFKGRLKEKFGGNVSGRGEYYAQSISWDGPIFGRPGYLARSASKPNYLYS